MVALNGGENKTRTSVAWGQRRPEFYDASDYIAHVGEAIRLGCDFWMPATRDEYLILEECYPRQARRLMPSRAVRELLGLPDDYCQKVEPISRRLRRAMIAAIEQDADFRAALRVLLVEVV